MKRLKKISFKDERKNVLNSYISKRHLKYTKQREIIFDEFFNNTDDHVAVEELYDRIKASNHRIGYATIYRTLKLFKECGLAFERNFGDGMTRYEPITFDGEHHDHIICTECSKIVCFNEPKVEKLLQEIAKISNFDITNYRLELHGKCTSGCKEECMDS